jgi:hypothetical protein
VSCPMNSPRGSVVGYDCRVDKFIGMRQNARVARVSERERRTENN